MLPDDFVNRTQETIATFPLMAMETFVAFILCFPYLIKQVKCHILMRLSKTWDYVVHATHSTSGSSFWEETLAGRCHEYW